MAKPSPEEEAKRAIRKFFAETKVIDAIDDDTRGFIEAEMPRH